MTYLMFSGAVGVCTYQIYELFTTYRTYPIQTSVSLHNSQQDFPAITICNMNPIRWTKIPDTDELHTLLYGSEPGAQDGDFDTFFDYLYDDEEEESTDDSDKSDSYYIWYDKVMARFRELSPEVRKSMGHDIDDMLHSAKFAGMF